MNPEHIALLPPEKGKEDQSEKYSKWAEKGEWIKNNINMRRCTAYRPSKKKDTCKCGYPARDHKLIDEANTSSEWELLPTNAFGRMKFVTHGGNVAEYVRVDRETDQSTLLKLMLNVWGMKRPNLIISVVVGAAGCHMNPSLINSFQRHFMKAASSTDAWIITGGVHSGMMKYVGQAVKKHALTSGNQESVNLIGIAPWGVIQNRQSLENNQLSEPASYSIEKIKKSREIFLDPNHGYFILVDDGTQHNYATEISFRAGLERKISNVPATRRDDKDQISLGSIVSSVPTVILVLEGGKNVLETLRSALNENTPAVIIEGSGGAADILAYAFKHAQTVEVEVEVKVEVAVKDEYEDEKVDVIKRTEKRISPEVEANIRKQMKDILFFSKRGIDENLLRIKECIDKSCLIHILEWNSDTRDQDLPLAILKALLKANKNQVRNKKQQPIAKTQQLKDNKQLIDYLGLALVWNMFDIAKSEIFTANQRWKNESLDDTMLLAMLMNRAKFVELFLDNGINLKKFLTEERLLKLYKQVSSTSLLKSLIKTMRQTKNEEMCDKSITLKEVGQLVQHLLGDYYNVDKFQDAINPERELLIWSVLNNHQETAELFWRLGQDAIAAALVASALYSAMSHQTDDQELKKQFRKNANKFTDLANCVLKESNRTDTKTTQRLLVRMVENWGKTSCIMIAIEAKNMEFISQKECQGLFKCIWQGKKIQENGTPRIKGQSHPPPDDKDESVTNAGTENKVKSSSFRKTPVFAFYCNMISIIIFLGLYSFILISKLEEKLSVEEIVLIVWVITIFLEEIRQITELRWHKIALIACHVMFCEAYTRAIGKSKFRTYIQDGWNKLDVITILLFATGMILRAIPYPQALEAARVVLSVNLVTFFTRLMHIFCVHKELGPKLVMILHTLKSLPYFVVILMVFTVSYAIASHAILYPNTELTLDNFIAIFRRPYWNIYGDLMLNDIEGDVDCSRDAELYRNGTHSRCPTESGKYFGPVLMVAYMLMSNTLLLNLLIVMLGEEYKKVKNNVDMYWNLQLLSLIDEYYSRPIVPPPFSVFVYVYWLIKRICHGEKRKTRKRAFLEYKEENEDVRKFEKETADKFHYKMTQEVQNDKQSKDLRVEKLVDTTDILQQQQQTVTETIDDLLKGQKRLEEQMEKQVKLVEKQNASKSRGDMSH